ncbi:LysR family transcriptional regulator [Marinivivus vitaminiproducens]|uniref:LysR family transcriptional regulator n=1 Tax=Marinivivus vitaminiproducens TaxID=3035935 RepID=UPI0027A6D069|nr:LysR family transcriptional regulator [Geminicoccaceae bacterium SCSIO 64248]
MPVNLASIELRLLVIFDAVIAHGNVSGAAAHLGMSQPAVSNALNRLRQLLNDRLFIRTVDGMRPTPRAEDLAPPIRAALRQIEEALEATLFDAADANWTFNLAVSDQASVVLLPHLLEQISIAAPRIVLRIVSRPNEELPAVLDANEIDLAIGVIQTLPKRFKRMTLYDDGYVCMMRHDHPLAGRPITREEFLTCEHLAVKPGAGDMSRADRLLASEGIRRRTVTTVHQFLAVPGIIARSDLIVLIFEKMAPVFDRSRFYFSPVPIPNLQVTATAVWSDVHTDRPAHRWLRRQLTAAARRITDEAA